MAKESKSKFSCRPDTVTGPWAMDANNFNEYQQRVFDALGRGEFKIKTSDDLGEETPENVLSALPYMLDDKGLAHIELNGPLTKYPTSFSALTGGTSMVQMKMALRDMMADSKVKAVMIHADSPGGTVAGTADLVQALKKFDETKPVVTHIDGMGCSGMYWIASATRYISASPTSEIGSVGAVQVVRDFSGNLERQGIKVMPITNTGADKKAIGCPGTPIDAEAKQDIERRLNDLVKPFQTQVQSGRGLTGDQTSEIFKAGVYEATPALAKGLIDSIDFQEDAVRKVHEAMQTPDSPIFKRGRQERVEEQPTPRSIDMKFTPELIQRAQKLPGCTAVTDEAATSAESLVSAAEQINTRLASVEAENTQLKTKVASITPVPEKAILDERVQLKSERLDLLVEKGNITKVQADTVKAALQADPMLVCAAPGKKAPFDVMLETFTQGKVGVQSGEQTQPQPNNPIEPNRSDPKTQVATDEEEGRKQGEAARKAALAARGIKD